MENILIETEFIKLSQLLKLASLVSSGAEAKIFINEGEVFVNNVVATERGKKIYNGDVVKFNGSEVTVISQEK